MLLLLGRLVLRQAHLGALPHIGVDRALARLADEDIVKAAAAHDAGANLLGMASGHFAGGLGIGYKLTGHTHRVAVSLRDDLLAHVKRVDARTGEHRLVRDGLDLLGQIDELAFGHDLVRHGARRFMEACLDAPGIHAVGFDDGNELLGVLDAVAAGHEIVGGDADEDGHVVAAGLMHLIDDLGKQTGAILGASAIFIGTMVGVLRQKAHDHVADTGMNLDDIDARILGALGGLAVLLHDDGDLLFGVLAFGHSHERAALNVFGRSIRQQRVISRCTPLVAQLQLNSHLGAVLVANLGDTLETGDELVVPNTAGTGGGMVLRLGVEAVAHIGAANLDEAHAALGALLVEVNQVVGHMIVVDLLDRHGQHDEPIAQLDVAD